MIWKEQRDKRTLNQEVAEMCSFFKAMRQVGYRTCREVFGLTYRQIHELLEPDIEWAPWAQEDPELRKIKLMPRRLP